MRSFRKHIFTLAASVLVAVVGTQAQQRTLTWNWANTICGEMLSCNTGCSACNQPLNPLPDFYGTNAAWIGISTCPEPTVTGDNAVFSEGWTTGPDPLKKVLISGMATGPMWLDSIIIRHRSDANGPTWLRVSLKLDLSATAVPVYEGPIDAGLSTLKLADLGAMDIPEGYTAAGFQLQLQAFGSEQGAWVLDEVRAVGSMAITTGTAELTGRPADIAAPMYDLLGRPVHHQQGLGISHTGKRVVVVP
ncbi:MAG: hypothetical protein IT230_08275 [Flavobacteriales bacterium]|nr:hypothetical protein [Flavobacteriales bacterium]